MIKKLLLSTAAIVGLTGLATAADMPLKAPAPVALYDWSGFYIGGFVGGGWFHNDAFDPDVGFSGLLFGVPLATPVSTTTTGSGFIGGIEGGDRYQFGKLV
jgi:outer membrane immunogenic protein